MADNSVQRVKVFKFKTVKDRDAKRDGEELGQERDGEELGEAGNIATFTQLVNKADWGTIFGYQTLDGRWLSYGQVEDLFGVPRMTNPTTRPE